MVAVNGLALWHARAMTRFAEDGRRPRHPRSLSALEAAVTLVRGVRIPRPRNRLTPEDRGLAFERHVLTDRRGLAIEGWLIPGRADGAVIVMFHGHAASKDSLLPAATMFNRMGFATFLVDFYGSGGSSGNETSVGFHEADDVGSAVRYLARLRGNDRTILYGQSMGAAAVLKALSDERLAVEAAIVECPFDSLLTTIKHRFDSMGVPAFPLAHTLTLWGGVQHGFNAFRHNPAEYARAVDIPVLVMNGDRDEWVTVEEAKRIHANLRGPKRLKVFRGLGHQSFVRARPAEWEEAVVGFLGERAVHP